LTVAMDYLAVKRLTDSIDIVSYFWQSSWTG